MSYRLKFLPTALKEWHKLGPAIRDQFKKKLAERLENPRVPKDRLSGFSDHYKLKLRSVGYRLVYEVIDKEVVVLVIAVGKREGGKVYSVAKTRVNKKKS
ncbi:MAG: type II toxin-antitoxin system RelE/ParE family toxin [Candidatus Dadabacteria bacterium]|nr:MAG: type II toxin-antitoxin system RelE/ParE family toxin [Candidatus Dadabacteria bacterium]